MRQDDAKALPNWEVTIGIKEVRVREELNLTWVMSGIYGESLLYVHVYMQLRLIFFFKSNNLF